MVAGNRERRGSLGLIAVAGLALVGIGGAAGWYAHDSGLGGSFTRDRTQFEAAVREALLEHPEVLPEAMDKLREKETHAQLANVRGQVQTPFPGAVLGNPQGKVTLVEFSDFACGFCRQSVPDVEALLAANPDLRVVMRELPILSPESADAARWALAAAEQGKYSAFHRAMFATGRPSPETIAAAAQTAGLDIARAKATIADPRIDAEIKHNVEIARQLGFQGTPSWVAGNAVLTGAVGKAQLQSAIGAAS
jgi:protein-disulfide isomerase